MGFFTTLLKTKERYPSLSLSEMDGYSSWICVSKRSLDRKKGVMQFNFQSPWLKLDIANTPSPNVHLCDGIFEDCPSKCLRDPCTSESPSWLMVSVDWRHWKLTLVTWCCLLRPFKTSLRFRRWKQRNSGNESRHN